MHISDEGINIIKHFEGCPTDEDDNCVAYQDAVGVWTIGFGHIKDVQEGDKWSKEKADFMLWRELEDEYESYINDYVHVPLVQCQFDALCSWVYNLGPANLKKSTLLKVLNNGEYDKVGEQIKRWNKAGGKVLQGLVRRREAEALLFEGKDWKNV
tara:strand:- start:1127 stop:1591 length:465 start_codon:yes stop_codon:yes gene_type:complete